MSRAFHAAGPSPGPGERPLAAVGWMVLTGILFVGVTAVVKHLGDRISAQQSHCLRCLLGLVYLSRQFLRKRNIHLMRPVGESVETTA